MKGKKHGKKPDAGAMGTQTEPKQQGYVRDVVDFEKYNAKHILGGIKDSPWRLLTGIDPASTWVWNKILGRDDEALVDQMGGAYDGHALSWGGDGGVYKGARKAGIDTGPGLDMHRAAHVIAAMYAAGGLSGMGGGGATPEPAGGTGAGGGTTPATQSPWQSPQTYMRLAQNQQGGTQQQAQQQDPMAEQLRMLEERRRRRALLAAIREGGMA